MSLLLSLSDIESKLALLPQWRRIGNALIRVKTFPLYLDALNYVYQVGLMAEKHNHHPDIQMNFKRVEVRFWTHKAKGITDLDFSIAHELEKTLLT